MTSKKVVDHDQVDAQITEYKATDYPVAKGVVAKYLNRVFSITFQHGQEKLLWHGVN